MKTSEEKRKEIRELSKNLDESKIVDVQYSIISEIITISFKTYEEIFPIDDDKEYNNLIELLKNNQKEAELYTWQEIEQILKKWIKERHTIKEHTSVFDFLKNNIKPYKKLD